MAPKRPGTINIKIKKLAGMAEKSGRIAHNIFFIPAQYCLNYYVSNSGADIKLPDKNRPDSANKEERF
jgi:hypothetical protein